MLKNSYEHFALALEGFREATKKNKRLNLVDFCRKHDIDYERMRHWMYSYQGLTVADVRKESEQRTNPRPVTKGRRAKLFPKSKGRYAQSNTQAQTLTPPASATADNLRIPASAAPVKKDKPKSIYDMSKPFDMTDELRSQIEDIDVPEGYAVFVLSDSVHQLLDTLQGVEWDLIPYTTADIDETIIDNITLEFPEGTRTTMRNIKVGNISKILAAYQARTWAYNTEPRKTGLA